MQKWLKPWASRTCLFIFLFIVLGNALHLSMAAALLAAATGVVLAARLHKAAFSALSLFVYGEPELATSQDSEEWWRDHLAEIHTRKAGPPNNRTDRGDS